MNKLSHNLVSFALIMVVALWPAASLGAGADAKAGAVGKFVKEHVLLIAMQADLMEAIQEAFSYQLLHDDKEKKEFRKKIADFDKFAGQMKGIVTDKALAADLGKLVEAKKAVVKAAEEMFAKYEANKKPDAAAIKAFEAEVDALTKLYDKFEDDLGATAEKAGFLKNQFVETGWHIHRLHADAMEGIEEAMAYALTGEAAEKADFVKKMKDFDGIAKHLANDADHLKGDKARLALLKKVVDSKVELQAAAEGMFKDYEMKKAALPADVLKFEKVVDEFSGRFDALTDSILKGLVK